MTHILAKVADAYTPLLLIIALVFTIRAWTLGEKSATIQLLFIAVCAYSFMFIDIKLNLWKSFGLDYSTHTAAAFGLVLFISFRTTHLIRIALTSSLLGYAGLMVYLGYHSWKDIASTVLVLVAPFLTIIVLVGKSKLNPTEINKFDQV